MNKTVLLSFVLLALLGVAACGLILGHGDIAPIAKPAMESFDRALVKRGESLAVIGGCQTCHTKTGGRPFAGGLPLDTPFGAIHSTNITPDVGTGIGAWSEAAFIRAMREGVDRNGRHLYPAFPYDYYAKVTDSDLKAIYAFLMTRPAVAQKPSDNDLAFPFNLRPLLAGWKLLFHRSGEFQPDTSRDGEWNRGAYLVEGLGHCGACHSPRNFLGAASKIGPNAYGGGVAEGWWAPPLNATSPVAIPWTTKSLVNYLIDGWDGDHGIAAGPMTSVVNGLKDQSEDDVFAIAAYLMSLKGGPLPQPSQDKFQAEARALADKLEWGHPEAPPLPKDPVLLKGAAVFESQCATCHKAGGATVPLALTTMVNGPDAANLIAVSFHGIQPPRGALSRSMPGRASQISDQDMTALAQFIRARFSQQPAWHGIEQPVRLARKGGH